MAKISGSIPNFANGVSQQASALRMATQADAQVNAYSTVVDGLIKRPPAKRVAQISTGSVFANPVLSHFINRDVNEKYNVLMSKDGIRVFTVDGVERTVSAPAGYDYLDYVGDDKPPYRALSVSDYTFITNASTITALDSSNTSDALNSEALVHVLAGNYGFTYIIKINGTTVASFETPDGSSASQAPQVATTYIATQLRSDLIANGYNSGNWRTYIFKGSLVIKNIAGTDFSIDTDDGYNDNALKAFYKTAQDFEDLPSHCRNGFTIQITGAPGNQYDNYYVKFVTQDSSTSLGYWEEVPAPELELSFDATTMPHVLIRQADGSFLFQAAEWDERKAGDDETCPPPSFVGKAISEITFFKNRLGFLSGENSILGRAGSYFDWWRATATALLDDDPIDVASTVTGVTNFRSAAAFDDRLVLFADQNQLILKGSELLTPKTASIRPATAYATSSLCRPVVSGNVVFFTASRGNYSMVREFSILDDKASANEITGHVPQYIKGNITKLAASTREDLLVGLTDSATDTLYVYKYYWSNNQRLQASWSEWQFPGVTSILDAEFLDSKLYLVVQRDDGTYIEVLDVQPGGVDDGMNYVCHLDRRFSHNDLSSRVYDAVEDETTVPMTIDITTDDYLCVTSGEIDGTISGVSANIISKTPTEVVLDGDHTATSLYFGITYTKLYRLSTIYMRASGGEGKGTYVVSEGRLQLLSIILQSSKTSSFLVTVYKDGRSPKEHLRTAYIIDDPDTVTDSVVLTDDPFKVLLESRNTACSVEITNDSYLPSSLLSAEWVALYKQQSRRM